MRVECIPCGSEEELVEKVREIYRKEQARQEEQASMAQRVTEQAGRIVDTGNGNWAETVAAIGVALCHVIKANKKSLEQRSKQADMFYITLKSCLEEREEAEEKAEVEEVEEGEKSTEQ